MTAKQRKLFIHIGTHKTGTTSIQRFLTAHSALLSLDHIYVPKSGRLLDGHHALAWELRGDSRNTAPPGQVKLLLRELAQVQHHRIVISSEDFEYLQHYPIELHVFTEAIRALDIEPIFIVSFRNRADYLDSLIAELEKHGETHSRAWYNQQLAETDGIRVKGDWFYDFNRVRLVETWKKITGAHMIVLDYDKCCAGAGVVPSFLTVIGARAEIAGLGRIGARLNARASHAA
jgi:hypothetical protein